MCNTNTTSMKIWGFEAIYKNITNIYSVLTNISQQNKNISNLEHKNNEVITLLVTNIQYFAFGMLQLLNYNFK